MGNLRLALSPRSPALAARRSSPGEPPRPPRSRLSRTQKLALLAIFACVAATAGAVVLSSDLGEARIPIAGISLLCAFMAPAALPDWRGKVGFIVFMLFSGYVVLTPDPTSRPVPLPEVSLRQPPTRRQQSLRPNLSPRGGEFRAAAAHLSLRPPADAPDASSGAPATGAAITLRMRQILAADSIALRLDSISAIHDGSSGTSDWRFDVYVNRYLKLSVPRRAYRDSPDKRTLRLGRSEAHVPVARAQNDLVVQVTGIRAALFGNFPANGTSDRIPLAELDHGPRPVTVLVRADQVEHGEFSFHFTVRKVHYN